MSENDRKNSAGKDFIEEKIKDKPIRKKRFFINLLLAVIIAAAAACVAAFVFVFMVPVAEKVTGKEEVRSKISLTSEESVAEEPAAVTKEASATPEATPTEEPQEKDGTDPQEEETEETEETEEKEKQEEQQEKEDGPEDGEEQTAEEEVAPIVKEEIIYKELTIDDYITVHEKMSELAEKAQRSMVSVTGITSMMDYFDTTYENSQQITGVIVAQSDSEIYILTAYSVLEKVERIQVTFEDGYISDAYFLRSDPDTGLAVIKVNASGLPEETLGVIRTALFSTLNNVKAGDRIMALGTILGQSHSITYGTVISTSGTFSASDSEYDLISTDIGSTGSTGGIILNLRGTISGVIMPADKANPEASLTAFTSEGIKDLIEKLSNNEDRPYIGIHGMDVTDTIAERSGVAKGILITSIEKDSPAMLAGIMDHDILVKVNDTSVMTMAEYEEALSAIEPGTVITLVTMRMGNEGYTEMEFEVTVGEI